MRGAQALGRRVEQMAHQRSAGEQAIGGSGNVRRKPAMLIGTKFAQLQHVAEHGYAPFPRLQPEHRERGPHRGIVRVVALVEQQRRPAGQRHRAPCAAARDGGEPRQRLGRRRGGESKRVGRGECRERIHRHVRAGRGDPEHDVLAADSCRNSGAVSILLGGEQPGMGVGRTAEQTDAGAIGARGGEQAGQQRRIGGQ